MVEFIKKFAFLSKLAAKIYATTDIKNIASQAVLTRNGFAKVGELALRSSDGSLRSSFMFERSA
jgi:RimJ/RimL family protein N-acetyltransferase